jgi:RimJ/RimL family protein N-acetyltransferase
MDMLRGERLVLRRFRAEDETDLAAGCADPSTLRFLPTLPSPYRIEDARWWIAEGAPRAIAGGDWAYAFADPATDRIIGGGGIRRHGLGRGTVGYWVAPWARGRGVASEAARLLAEQAWRGGVERLELHTAIENTASQRVAIAAGFTREGVARGGGQHRDGSRYDHIVWARLATDSGEPTPRLLPDLPGRPGCLTDGIVTLRPLDPSDVDDVYALHTLPEVVNTSVPPKAPSLEDVRARCARSPSLWLAGQRADFTIRDAATDAFAGDIGLYYMESTLQQAMIGYSLTREWRGRGLTTRAVNLVAEWAFAHVQVARVIAGTAPDNAASHAVLQRAGFEREGYLRARLPGPDGTRIDDVQWVRLPPASATG